MFITADILREYEACGPGLKYIERFYPNGAEMIDLIRDRHIHKSFLHWGREHLTVTEEEEQAYAQACGIVNSKNYWYSEDVKNSKNIIRSKKVENSENIFHSTDIMNCKDIVGSDSIDNSNLIFTSSMVEDSEKVNKGANVTLSKNVCNSTMISKSKNVIDSEFIFTSSEIVQSKKVDNSHFIKECENIEKSMFCIGLTDVKFCIFNKPIKSELYEVIEKQYQKYMTEELNFIPKWPTELVTDSFLSPTRKFDDWYHSISEKFWKWARTLPNFDPMLLYDITMLPEFLLD